MTLVNYVYPVLRVGDVQDGREVLQSMVVVLAGSVRSIHQLSSFLLPPGISVNPYAKPPCFTQRQRTNVVNPRVLV